MAMDKPIRHRARRGLTLPIAGCVQDDIVREAPLVTHVGLAGADYVGMKPAFQVRLGDSVKRGQVLFADRANPGVLYTAPGAGEVTAVHRGEQRAFQSIAIRLTDQDNDPDDNEVPYSTYSKTPVSQLDAASIRALLQESGMWTAFRTRPYSRVPAVDSSPGALFVTAMDSNPLAVRPETVMERHSKAFADGMEVLSRFMEGRPIHYCGAAGVRSAATPVSGVTIHEFEGPHPAGTAGFHIHSIWPVNRERTAWHLTYPDVIAIGMLFATGKLFLYREISIAGPGAADPGVYRVRLGSDVMQLVAPQRMSENVCVISGSVFAGRPCSPDADSYLGRYHQQISLLPEDPTRRLLGWMTPGKEVFSVTRLFLSSLFRNASLRMTTDQFGGHRTMVPFGVYDRVMAFDILPVFLQRALLSEDLESAERLGAMELDEEDLALCTFVCPSKIEYGPLLRTVLTRLEKEG